MILRVAGPILLVKGYSCGVFCVEQAGLALRLEREGGEAAATLLRNQIIKALCMYEFAPLFSAATSLLAIHFQLKDCITFKITVCLTSRKLQSPALTPKIRIPKLHITAHYPQSGGKVH
jgi:hypothetical protein